MKAIKTKSVLIAVFTTLVGVASVLSVVTPAFALGFQRRDNIAPTVQITTLNPRRVINANEVVYLPTDIISVMVTASDNVAVTRVRILNDGIELPTTCVNGNRECTATLPPSRPNVFGVWDDLRAEAYDAAGNKSTAFAPLILIWNITDNTAPVVTLSASRTQAQTDQAVTLTAIATDNVRVQRIVLYWGNAELKICNSTSTCSHTFNSLPPVPNRFTAKAYDASYNIGLSNEVLVNVVSVPVQPLAISISTDRNNYSASDVVTFTARSPQVVKKINILVNARIVKECADTNICTYIGGPYPTYAGTGVSYGANAYDPAGNRVWTGYKGIGIRAVRR